MSLQSSRHFNKVFVVGSGLMGAGITQVVAQAGIAVINYDVSNFSLLEGEKQINKGLNSLDNKEKNDVLNRITFTTDINDGKDCDLVIEAVPEKIKLKQEVFKQLDQIMKDEAILATNTSSLSVSAIASVTSKPENVIGLHFFSPVPVMSLLEIVRGINTSEAVIEASKNFAKQINKEIIIANDYPGFTVNRVLVPMMNEAAYLVFEGNNPAEVDKGLMLGANHPIGPLKLADMVGVDVLLFTLESLYEGFNDSKYRPCPLLKRMVEAGKLGRKTGEGFYEYR